MSRSGPTSATTDLMRVRRLAVPLLFVTSACGQVPAETEKARGILTGFNLVLALSVIVLIAALALLAVLIGIDRTVRNRRRLSGAPLTGNEEPDEEEVVAGIVVGRAPVPRWLYGAYVLIPVFAFAYVVSNIRPPAREDVPAETAPPVEPCTECQVVAVQIEFDEDVLMVPATSEITVALDNQDVGVPHDFTVWAAAEPGSGEQVSTTGTIAGGASGETTFTSPTAGERWSYNCTIHPASMIGTFQVVE